MSRNHLNNANFHQQPNGRREFYTRQNPRGTGRHIVTTTVQTNYLDNPSPRNVDRRHHRSEMYADEEQYYGCVPGKLNTRYCTGSEGILKIGQIVICLIVICLITSVFGPGPFKGILFGQTFIMLFVGISLCLTFIFLIVHFFTLHQTLLDFWPWAEIFCSPHLPLSFSSSVHSLSHFTPRGRGKAKAMQRLTFPRQTMTNCHWHRSNNCNDIGGDGVIHNGCRLIWEWAFAAFLLFTLCVLFSASAFFAKRQKTEERRIYLRERNAGNFDR